MKILFFIAIVFLCFCVNSCGYKCIKYGKSDTEHEIFIHALSGYGVDGYMTAEYWLVITNYLDNTMTTKAFVDIAQKFVDTVKSERPIEDVIFLGQIPGGCIPDIDFDDKPEKKYGIVAIGFEGSNPENKGNLKELSYVIYYDKGKPSDKIFYLNDPRVKDSILNSKKTINNW